LQRQELEKKEQATVTGVLWEDWDSLTLPKLFGAVSEGTRKRLLSKATNQAAGRETYDDKDLGDDAYSKPKRVRLHNPFNNP